MLCQLELLVLHGVLVVLPHEQCPLCGYLEMQQELEMNFERRFC